MDGREHHVQDCLLEPLATLAATWLGPLSAPV